MSDLGAIFHVKKAGVQYDAHAYTTIDECPYPNLKIKFKEQQAYVKMEQGKGNGDVPCYAKDKAGVIYQVRKEAISTGSISETATNEEHRKEFNFTVPAQIHVLHAQISHDGKTDNVYVGVTPNKTYTLYIQASVFIVVAGHHISGDKYFPWYKSAGKSPATLTISWSSEVNTHTPDVNDY